MQPQSFIAFRTIRAFPQRGGNIICSRKTSPRARLKSIRPTYILLTSLPASYKPLATAPQPVRAFLLQPLPFLIASLGPAVGFDAAALIAIAALLLGLRTFGSEGFIFCV